MILYYFFFFGVGGGGGGGGEMGSLMMSSAGRIQISEFPEPCYILYKISNILNQISDL